MKKTVFQSLRHIAQLAGLDIMTAKRARHLEGSSAEVSNVFDFVLKNLGEGKSHSQLRQDIFALIANGFKQEGYFVEFGATDGLGLSNSYLLEKEFSWNGILAEPAKGWHTALSKNRTCHISFDCVWSRSGEVLKFVEEDAGAYSTLTAFRDNTSRLNEGDKEYEVRTISLMELLKKFSAPSTIDYLSVDTEGSELNILESFDFERYTFNAVTVEHNYSKDRERIFALLTQNGYRRVFNYLSKWDDWYVPLRSPMV